LFGVIDPDDAHSHHHLELSRYFNEPRLADQCHIIGLHHLRW